MSTENNKITFLSNYFTSKAILLYVMLLSICSVLFINYSLPLIWILFGLIEVISFFYFSNILTIKWAHISEKEFKKRVFLTSLTIRIIYVVIIYFFFEYMTGKPFEFSAADSEGYHNEALWIIDLLGQGRFSAYFTEYTRDYGDRGYPLFLFGIYFIFGSSIIIPRLVNAFLGAWMSIITYKLVKRNFGESPARIAAILTMLLPNLIYYSGLTLKETLMVFLFVAFIERAQYFLDSNRKRLPILITAIMLGTSLFFFRTVLATSAWLSIFVYITFNKKIGIPIVIRAIFLVIFVLISYKSLPDQIVSEVNYYILNSENNLESQMIHFSNRTGGNKYAQFASKTILSPLVLIGPIPTLVDTAQPNPMMINGAMFVRNIFVFFAIFGTIIIFRKKIFLQYSLLFITLFSYLFILSFSGFALSERYHLPSIPFLIIFASYGISEINKKHFKYYIPYLVGVFVLVIAWNWFKLAGRGLI